MGGSLTTGGLLVEREAELACLVEAVPVPREGTGVLITCEGPAGIGKSVLLERAAGIAADAGLRVLHARASQLEQDIPFGVARQLFAPTLRAAPDRRAFLAGAAALAGPIVLDQPSGPAPDISPDAGPALAHALYWLCANVAERTPLLICVDDLHWADAPSLRHLALLASRIRELPVALAVATRTGEDSRAPEALAALLSVPGARALAPRPLSETGVGAVVEASLGDADAAFSQACHASVAGNPFLLGQLLVELERMGVQPRAERIDAVHISGPRAVSRSMLARVAALPGGATELAAAVAVLGDGCRPRHAATLAGLSDDDAATAADALVRAAVLRRGRTLAFVHPIVRQAVYEDLGVHDRARRHGAAARLLHEDGAPPDRIAAHLVLAPSAADGWVVGQLRDAARTALARGEPGTAARYLERALDEPPEAAQRVAVLRELGRSELLAADPAGLRHLTAARDLTTDVLERAAIALDLAPGLYPLGDFDAIERLLGASLAEVQPVDADTALLLQTELVSGLQNIPRGAALLPGFERLVGDLTGDTPAERYALALLANVRVRRGERAADQVTLARRALGGGALLTDLGAATPGVMYALASLIWADAHEAAEDTAHAMLDLSARDGSVFRSSVATYALSVTAFRQGDVRRAEEDARDCLETFVEAGWAAAIGMGLMALTDALIERDALDEAEAELERHGCTGDLPELITYTWLLASRGRLRLARGDAHGALADLLAAGERNIAIGTRNPAVSPWREDAITAYLQLGRRDDAAAMADEHLALASAFDTPRAVGVALRTRGLCDPSEAGIADLRRAVEMLGPTGASLDHARALADLGAALRRANRRAEARPVLSAALDAATRIGATRLASRTIEDLHATGARPRRMLLTGVDSLTASERRVCRLASEGLTNREIAQALFVSGSTVETHLSHAYAKLDIRSRAQLAEALARD